MALSIASFAAFIGFARRRQSLQGSSQQNRTDGTISKRNRQLAVGRRSRFQNALMAPIFCIADARAYTHAANALALADDIVLEIGCQLNGVTKALSAKVQRVVGIDIDRKPPTSQRKELRQDFYRRPDSAIKGVDLHVMDVWDLHALHEIVGRSGDIRMVFVDGNAVLGNDLPFEVLALLRAVSRTCPTLRAIVVKSRALALLQHQLRPAPSSRPLLAPVSRAGVSGSGAAGEVLGLPIVIAADLVNDYRNAAMGCLKLLQAGECALEIGSHMGASTAKIHAALAPQGGYCVGVDNSHVIIQKAREVNPEVPFTVADAWDVGSLRTAMRSAVEEHGGRVREPALLMIDVGGLSGANGTLDALALIRMLSACFQASLRAVVIKSACMRNLARALRHVHETQEGKFAGDKQEPKRA